MQVNLGQNNHTQCFLGLVQSIWLTAKCNISFKPVLLLLTRDRLLPAAHTREATTKQLSLLLRP